MYEYARVRASSKAAADERDEAPRDSECSNRKDTRFSIEYYFIYNRYSKIELDKLRINRSFRDIVNYFL